MDSTPPVSLSTRGLRLSAAETRIWTTQVLRGTIAITLKGRSSPINDYLAVAYHRRLLMSATVARLTRRELSKG